MQTRHVNDFFEKTFGRNDFEPLDDDKFSLQRTVDYILKYMEKTGERVFYSRHIPTEIMMAITDEDVSAEFIDYVCKMVLYDDVVDIGMDVLNKGRGNPLAKTLFKLRC